MAANTRLFVESNSIRTQAPVNFIVNAGGELFLPLFTTLTGLRKEGALYTKGGVYGIESLRLYKGVRSVVTEKGHTTCFGCNSSLVTPYESHYWFGRVNVMKDAVLEVKSNLFNVDTASAYLHIKDLELDYSGKITPDVVTIYTDALKFELDSGIDATQRGWLPVQGPGATSSCSRNVAGAGHGGPGGKGRSRNCNGELCAVLGR